MSPVDDPAVMTADDVTTALWFTRHMIERPKPATNTSSGLHDLYLITLPLENQCSIETCQTCADNHYLEPATVFAAVIVGFDKGCGDRSQKQLSARK